MVRVERVGAVAVILVDNPPVNALSYAVRAGLVQALDGIAGDGGVRAVVLACEGRTFIAGADIREFDAPPRHPLARDVMERLDGFPKPVVAAIHGTALGGGLEVAMGCHARIAHPTASVGLPEVKLGLIPGAGGTVLATRLAGPAAALDMATTGRMVKAGEALALGLVDGLSETPREEAVLRAGTLADAGTWRRTLAVPVPEHDPAALEKAAEGVRRKARGALAPGRAAEAVIDAARLPAAEALEREQKASLALRSGPQSRALRHLFHAERVAAKAPEGATAREVSLAAVIGGGTMGSGIALAMAEAGIEVALAEVSDAAVEAARGRVRAVLDRQREQGRIDERVHAARLGRIRFTTDFTDLAGADLAVEAVIEDMAAKQDVFRRLGALMRADAVLATNTSYLDVGQIAAVVPHPARVLGLHFFSPAHVMRLLEVVRAPGTSDDAVATGLALAKRLRKLPVVCGVCDGFIGNRILFRTRQQAEYALEDGATVPEVDAAMEAYGFPMGPFRVADMAGLDIGWATRKRKAATRDPAERYVPVADWICEQGRFGQKTGRGWYRHEGGKARSDEEVQALVERASEARGTIRRPVPMEEIQQRLHATMVNEGARILAEGVAARAADIDLVLVNGYGYPAWRGGPMHEADEIGLPEVLRRVEALHRAGGAGWEPAPLLIELARAGGRFGRG